jgi:hypothetical protein
LLAEARKYFFFEKKKQKTFTCLTYDAAMIAKSGRDDVEKAGCCDHSSRPAHNLHA